MIHHRTAEEVKRFDLFKLITVIILSLLFIALWPFRPDSMRQTAEEEAGTEQVAPADEQSDEPADQAVADSEPTDATTDDAADETADEEEPTAESVPDIVPPTLNPLPGEAIAGETSTLSGTGQPDSEIEVVVDGDVVGTASVDSQGDWSYDLSLADAGDYDITVQAIDEAGQVVATADALALSVAAPAINPPTVDLPDFAALAPGDEATISGTAQPDSEVEVVVDGDVVGTAPVDSDGNWNFILPEFAPGQYDLGLRNIDSDGNLLAEAEPTTFEWPDFATGAATDDTSVVTTLNLGEEALPGGQLMLTGTGAPNSEVEILVDGDAVGQAPVDAEGNWVFDLTLTDPGDYEISAQTVDANGQVITAATPVTVSITETATPSPTPTPTPTSSPSPTPTPTSTPTPAIDATTVPTETTTSAPAASGDLSIIFPADGADVLVGELTVTGRGPAGEDVEVLDQGAVLGTTQVGSDSEWRYTLDVVEGRLELAARLAGSQSVPDEVVDVRVVQASDSYDCASNPGLDRGTTYLVGTCDTLGSIAREAGVTFAELIEANDQIDNPDLIYPGESINIPGR